MFYLSARRGVGEAKLGFFALNLEFLLISHVNQTKLVWENLQDENKKE